MEENLINAQEVAYRVGCSIQTLSSYYRFKNEKPDNEYAMMLPDFVRIGNKNTRYWKESDVAEIIRFRNLIPQGRNGALGCVTQKYVHTTSKKVRKTENKQESKENISSKQTAFLHRAYIDKVTMILQDNSVEADVIDQIEELLTSELNWRRELGIA